MTPPNVQCIYHHNICFVLIVKIYVKPMLKSRLQIQAFGGFPLLILKKNAKIRRLNQLLPHGLW